MKKFIIMDDTDQFLDIMIMRQLVNISPDNFEPITQTFIMKDLISDINQKIRKFAEVLPSVITIRPDSAAIIVDLAQMITTALSEQEIIDFKKDILQRLIHDFHSNEIIERYAAIANFVYIAVQKHFFQSYDVANAVHSLMISKPHNHRILVEFFFWFAPEFNDLSATFLRSLKHYVEIEQISRTLPIRYKALLTRVNDFTRAKWVGYDEQRHNCDEVIAAIRGDAIVTFKQIVRQRGVNYRVQAHPFETHWMLFYNPTLVQVCAYFSAVNCFAFLVQKGADLTLLDTSGRSVSDFAIVGCNTEIISMLVTAGCSFVTAVKSSVLFHHEHVMRILPKSYEIGTALNEAILSNNISALTKCDMKINMELLMYAVECESSLIFRKMVLCSPNIDLNEMIAGRSILHVAVQTQQVMVISWLLSNEKVDVNIRNAAGKTPLQIAVETLNPSVISLLLSCPRVDVDVRWDSGKSMLHVAILRGGIDAVAVILECERFDVNCRDINNQTGLHYATRNINSMGTHIVIDPGINSEPLVPERYVFSYAKLVHTHILRFMLRCTRVQLDVFDNAGVSL